MLTLVSGGSASGKSEFAESLRRFVPVHTAVLSCDHDRV